MPISWMVGINPSIRFRFIFSQLQPKASATDLLALGVEGFGDAVIPISAYRRRSEACTLAVSKMTGMCRVAGLACNFER